jgi:hypothetical protein
MDVVLDEAARLLATVYVVYMFLLGVTTFFGLQLVMFAVLLGMAWRRRRQNGGPFAVGERAYPLQVIYGFVNPLAYLLILTRDGAMLRWNAFDGWLTATAWTLFIALWGARLLVARDLEVSPAVRTRLHRLCVLALACLCAFALRDFLRLWLPPVLGASGLGRAPMAALWLLVSFAPLYLIPALILNSYRQRLAQPRDRIPFVLLSRPATRRVAIAFGALGALTVLVLGASIVRSSDGAARARVERLAPAIREAAERYAVDPSLVAAIVYVSERDVGPFRDQIERFASGMFLMDEGSHAMLAPRFDLSIGAAQIKPVTALTALKLCRESGQPWELWSKHLRDVPQLGSAWKTRPSMRDICHSPVSEVPRTKPDVVTALRHDESNVAFAALILALYQWQWREANAAWDISGRPDILATLYQIGFLKSRPHDAPRSSAFGQRVAEVSRETWLRQHFEHSRVATRGLSRN